MRANEEKVWGLAVAYGKQLDRLITEAQRMNYELLVYLLKIAREAAAEWRINRCPFGGRQRNGRSPKAARRAQRGLCTLISFASSSPAGGECVAAGFRN
jgi:hypothetical protein